MASPITTTTKTYRASSRFTVRLPHHASYATGVFQRRRLGGGLGACCARARAALRTIATRAGGVAGWGGSGPSAEPRDATEQAPLLRSWLLCLCGGPVRCLASFRLGPLVNDASRRRAAPAAAPSRTLSSTNRAGVCLACYVHTAPACRDCVLAVAPVCCPCGIRQGIACLWFSFSKPR